MRPTERPEVAALRQTQEQLREADRAEQDAAARFIRERTYAASLGELSPWSVAPFLVAPLLRIAEDKENA